MKKQQVNQNQIEGYIGHKKVLSGKLKRIIALLSAVVLLVTINTLKFNADTLERIPTCGMMEHVHDSTCCDEDGNLICGMQEHTHTDACYQERPTSENTGTRFDEYIDLDSQVVLATAQQVEGTVGETEAELGADEPEPEPQVENPPEVYEEADGDAGSDETGDGDTVDGGDDGTDAQGEAVDGGDDGTDAQGEAVDGEGGDADAKDEDETVGGEGDGTDTADENENVEGENDQTDTQDGAETIDGEETKTDDGTEFADAGENETANGGENDETVADGENGTVTGDENDTFTDDDTNGLTGDGNETVAGDENETVTGDETGDGAQSDDADDAAVTADDADADGAGDDIDNDDTDATLGDGDGADLETSDDVEGEVGEAEAELGDAAVVNGDMEGDGVIVIPLGDGFDAEGCIVRCVENADKQAAVDELNALLGIEAPEAESGRLIDYAVFDISLEKEDAEVAAEGEFAVVIRPQDINILSKLSENASFAGTKYTLYRVNGDAAEALDASVDCDAEGALYSISFVTEGLSRFVLRYDVYYSTETTVYVDFSEITAQAVTSEDQSVLTALNDGVSVSIAGLEGGMTASDAQNDENGVNVMVDGVLNVSYEALDTQNEDIPAPTDWSGMELIATTGGVEIVDDQMKVTGDGMAILSDGVDTINIVVSDYTQPLEENLPGDGVNIQVVDGAVPAGSEAQYSEHSEDTTQELVEQYEEIIKEENKPTEENKSADVTVGAETGYTSFGVSIAMPEGGEFKETGEFAVEIDKEVDPEALVPEGATLTNVTYVLYHIHDDGSVDVIDDVQVADGKVQFTANGFSDFVLSYTVDFEYVNPETGEKKAWSLPGRGEYAVGDIMDQIGAAGDITEVSLARVKDVGGSDKALYLSDDHAKLISEVPFKDTFELTAVVGGKSYVIAVTDDGPAYLDQVAEPITITLNPATDIDRSDKLKISIRYEINGTNGKTVANAIANVPWIYDLSAFCGESKVFSNIIEVNDGVLMSGDAEIGAYTIHDNIVTITPKDTYLEAIGGNTEIHGTIDIYAMLNTVHNYRLDEEKFTFPGASETTITYMSRELSVLKTAGPAAGDESYDGTSGQRSFDVTELTDPITGDKYYKIFWKIAFTPTTVPDTLTLTDRFTAGNMTLVPDSIAMTDNWSNQIKYYNGLAFTEDVDGKGFTVDVKQSITNYQQELKPGHRYYITYVTTIPAEGLNKDQTNQAEFTYDGQSFPTSTTVKPKWESEVKVYKFASNNPHDISAGDGSEIAVVKEGDKYAIWWKADAKPNQAFESFTLTDIYGPDQTLDASTIQIKIDGLNDGDYVPVPSEYIDFTTSGQFTVNVSGYLNSIGESVKANTKYRVRYKTTISAALVNEAAVGDNPHKIDNTARWTADGTNTEKEIEIIPKHGVESYGITKTRDASEYYTASGEPVEDSSRQDETPYPAGAYGIPYTITVDAKDADGGRIDLSGMTVVDYIDAENVVFNTDVNGNLVLEDFDVQYMRDRGSGPHPWSHAIDKGANPFTYMIEGPMSKAGTGFTGAEGDTCYRITITFPSDSVSKQFYTTKNPDSTTGLGGGYSCYQFNYTIRTKANNVDDTIGWRRVRNTATFMGQSASKDLVIAYDSPTLRKDFLGWDMEEDTASWKVRITVPAGKKLINAVLCDDTHYGIKNNNYNQITMPFYGDVVVKKAGTDTVISSGYTVTTDESGNKKITFASLNESVDVYLKTKCHESLSNVRKYYAYNHVRLNSDNLVGSTLQDDADGVYYRQDFDFNKNGQFDKKTQEATWVVEINNDNTILNTDVAPIFYDVLPDGMELVPGSMELKLKPGNNLNSAGLKVDEWTITGYEPLINGQEIGPVDLAAAFREDMGKNVYNDRTAHAPSGVSGMHYTVTYKTRVTDEKLLTMSPGNTYNFKNQASLYDRGGDRLKTDSDSVTYIFDKLLKKTDMSDTDVQLLRYKVDINPDGGRINDGNPLILYDQVTTDMTLRLDSIHIFKVTGSGSGETEAEITNSVDDDGVNLCTIAYDDDTRVLEVYVPDGMHVRVKFSATPREGSVSHAYVNTVTLKGLRFIQTDVETKEHVVQSSGTLSSSTHFINLTKVDKYNVTEKLKNAQFKLYEGTLLGNEVIGTLKGTYNTGDTGEVTFPGIQPVKLYYWVETVAPAGYTLDSTPHYFVMYQELKGGDDIVTVKYSALSDQTKAALKAAFPDRAEALDSLGQDDTIYVANRAPLDSETSQQRQDSFYLNRYTPPEYASFKSLADEVNQINRQEAKDLDHQIQNQANVTVAAIPDGYNWQYTNVRQDVTKVELKAKKKMIGRAAKAGEFGFELYDAANLDTPLQIKPCAAADEGEIQEIDFSAITYVVPGTYNYVIKETQGLSGLVIYDGTEYRVKVVVTRQEVEEDGQTKLVASEPVYTRDGITVSDALFTNRVNDASITVNKTFVDAPDELQISDLYFTVTDKANPGTPIATIYYAPKEGQTREHTVLEGTNTLKGPDIVPGHTYQVVETAVDMAGYTRTTSYTIDAGISHTGVTANVPVQEKAVVVSFTNKYEPTTIELLVSKQWMYNGNPVSDFASEQVVYFNLYKRANSGEVWAKVNPDDAPYSMIAPSWFKRITGLDNAEYKVVECGADGTELDLPNNIITYYIGKADGSVVAANDDDNVGSQENNKLYIRNKLAQLNVYKFWKDLDGNQISNATQANVGVQSVSLKLQKSTDCENWTDVAGTARTIQPREYESGYGGATQLWDISPAYKLAIFDPAGNQYYYRVVETGMTLYDGTVLEGEAAVGDYYTLSQKLDNGSAEAEYIQISTTPGLNTAWTYNLPVDRSLKVTKRWVKGDGVTDISTSADIAQDKVYFKFGFAYNVECNSGTSYMTSEPGAAYTWTGNAAEARIYTISRNASTGEWGKVSFNNLPEDPLGWGNSNKTYFFVVECDSEGTAISEGVKYVFKGNDGSAEREDGAFGDPVPVDEAMGTLTIVNPTNVIDIHATKVWTDAATVFEHPAITFRLYRDGTEVASSAQTIPANATGDALTVTWPDLPIKDTATQKAYVYSVREDPVEGYAVTYSGTAKDGFTVTNRPEDEEETGELTVTKAWTNDAKAKNPVKVTLYRLETDPVVLNVTINNNGNGENVTRAIRNVKAGDRINVTITNNGDSSFTIQNNNSFSPQINNTEIAEGGSYTIEDLAVTENMLSNGITLYNYSSNRATDFSVECVGGSNVRDLVYEPAKTMRHDQLEALGGTPVSPYVNVELREGEWTKTFDNLPVGNGEKDYKYYVLEQNGEFYSAVYASGAENAITVTNDNNNPEYTSLTVDKVWHAAGAEASKVKDGEAAFKLYQIKIVKGSENVNPDKEIRIRENQSATEKVGERGKIVELVYDVEVGNEKLFFANNGLDKKHLDANIKAYRKFYDMPGFTGQMSQEEIRPTLIIYNEGTKVARVKYTVDTGISWSSTTKSVELAAYTWQDGQTATLNESESSFAEWQKVDVTYPATLYAEFTLKASANANENWRKTFENLPLNSADGSVTYKYYVVEDPQDGVTVDYKVSGAAGGNTADTAVQSGTINVDNEYTPDTGSLEIVKDFLQGTDTKGHHFVFKVTLDNGAFNGSVTVKDAYRTTPTAVAVENGILYVVVLNKGKATISGLPEGTTYDVDERDYSYEDVMEEIPAAIAEACHLAQESENNWSFWKSTYDNDGKRITSGNVDKVTFVNYRNGWMKLKKLVKEADTENAIPTNAEYQFEITTVIDGVTYYVDVDEDGYCELKEAETPLSVTAGDKDGMVITWMPYGTYTVKEVNADSVAVTGYGFVNAALDVANPPEDTTIATQNAVDGSAEVVLSDAQNLAEVVTTNFYRKQGLYLKKAVEASTSMPVNGATALTDGTYTFTITKSGSETALHTVVITTVGGAMTGATIDGADAGAAFSAATGVVFSDLEAGTYIIKEAGWTIPQSPAGSGMFLESIEIPEGEGNSVNYFERTATVVVDLDKTPNIEVEFNNVLAPDGVTVKKQVADRDDSAMKSDGEPDFPEYPWNDSADHDIGDEVPYRVRATLPTGFYRSQGTYALTFHDEMVNLEYVGGSGRVYAFVKSDTDDVGRYYDVSEFFNMPADKATTLAVSCANLKAITRGARVTDWSDADTHSDRYPEADPETEAPVDFIVGEAEGKKNVNDIRYLEFRYRATLTENAYIGGGVVENVDHSNEWSIRDAENNITTVVKANTGNPNAARIEYTCGNGGTAYTNWDVNKVFTYELDVNKKDADGEDKTGSQFQLYKKYAKYTVTAEDESNKWTTATLASITNSNSTLVPETLTLVGDPDNFPDNAVLTDEVLKAGDVIRGDFIEVKRSGDDPHYIWKGLDDGKYRLIETAAPEGCVPLLTPITVNLDAYHHVDKDDPQMYKFDRYIHPSGVDLNIYGSYFVNDNTGTLVANIPNYQVGSLEIEKAIDALYQSDADGRDFTFHVKFIKDNKAYPCFVKVTDKTRTGAVVMTDRSGALDVTVSYDADGVSKAVIDNIPVGVTYEVNEPAGTIPTGWVFDKVEYTDSTKTISAAEEVDTVAVANKPFTVDVPVEKTWASFGTDYTWTATFALEQKEVLVSGTDATDAIDNWTRVTGAAPLTVSAQNTTVATGTFAGLPMYRYHSNGSLYRIMYSVEEIAYEAKDSNGITVAKWTEDGSETAVGNLYTPDYEQDAGEDDDLSDKLVEWYKVKLSNTLEKKTKEKDIDITIRKEWEGYTDSDETYAKFRLLRYVSEEYTDYSGVTDPMDTVTITLVDESGANSKTLTVPRGAKFELACTVKAGVNADIKFMPQSGSEFGIQYDNTHSAVQKQVHTRAFVATQNETLRVSAGAGNAVGGYAGIRVTDRLDRTEDRKDAGWTPIEVTLRKSNGWSYEFRGLDQIVRDDTSETRATYLNYSYYFEEFESYPADFYAVYTNADNSAQVLGDLKNRIEDNSSIVATNAPKPPFRVVKEWLDVTDTTGYPEVYFTLYWMKAADQNFNQASIYRPGGADDDTFVDIKLNEANNWTWNCPYYLPDKNDQNEPVKYFVVETPSDDGGQYIKMDEDHAAMGQFFRVMVDSYESSEPDGNGGTTTHKGVLWDQQQNARIGNTGEIIIKNRAPKYIQMDIKKKYLAIRENNSLYTTTSEDAMKKDLVLEIKLMRRTIRDDYIDGETTTITENNVNHTIYEKGFKVRYPDNTLHDDFFVYEDWKDYGVPMMFGYDSSGNAVDSNDNVFDLYYAGDWHWTIKDQNQNQGLEAYGFFKQEDGTVVPVRYQYILVELGAYKDLNKTPIDLGYEWTAILPDAWDGNGSQVPLFPRVVAQDQDRLVNVQASDVRIKKDWLDGVTNGVEEVYIKILRKAGESGTLEDFTNIIGQDTATMVSTEGGYVSKDRVYKNDGQSYLVLKSTDTEPLLISHVLVLPAVDGADKAYIYKVEECGYKDADGNVHWNVDQFMPGYDHWDNSLNGWSGNVQNNPDDVTITLGEKGTNGFRIVNTPTTDFKVVKEWYDTDGSKLTAPWDESITAVSFSVIRIAQKYTRISENGDWYLTPNSETTTNLTFREDGSQTSVSTLTVRKDGKRAQLAANADGGTEYTVTYVDDESVSDDWTVLVDGLQKLSRTKNNEEYRFTYKIREVTAIAQCSTSVEPAGAIPDHGTATIRNTHTNEVDIKVVKIDEETRHSANGQQRRLTGAKFKLLKLGETQYELYPADADPEGVEVDASGELLFTGLSDGQYKIEETKMPDGYVKTDSNDIYFTVHAGEVQRTQSDGTTPIDEDVEVYEVTYVKADGDNVATFTVGNLPGHALPSTGGMGTTAIYGAGIALLLLALLGFVVTARKRSRGDGI